MGGQKAGGVIVFIIQPQSLVSGDMNPGIFGTVFTFAVTHQSGVVAKYGFEFVVTLFAQFVPITQKQSRFWQPLGLMQAP